VVNGCLITRHWSSLLVAGADLRGYLGFLFKRKVLGRKKWTLVLSLWVDLVAVPFLIAFVALRAFSLAATTLVVWVFLAGAFLPPLWATLTTLATGLVVFLTTDFDVLATFLPPTTLATGLVVFLVACVFFPAATLAGLATFLAEATLAGLATFLPAVTLAGLATFLAEAVLAGLAVFLPVVAVGLAVVALAGLAAFLAWVCWVFFLTPPVVGGAAFLAGLAAALAGLAGFFSVVAADSPQWFYFVIF